MIELKPQLISMKSISKTLVSKPEEMAYEKPRLELAGASPSRGA